MKRVICKARHTTNRVARIADKASPFVGMINPEAGLALHGAAVGARAVSGGSLRCEHCGGVSAHGGSFKTTGAGVSLGRAESSILSSTHNSIAPMPSKSFKERKHTN